MTEINLSAWALRHRSFVIYCMISVVIAGLNSYWSLGRNEDPNFTFRTMIVQAAWPGATLDDTLKQVTERIERKLQETPSLDFIRSYTTAGLTTIFVNLKGETTPSQVPDIWYNVRKNVGDIRHTLPAGVVGPGFNDDFGDTFGIIYGFTADGFSHRELRDYVETVRSRLLNVADVSKIEVLGAQDERIFIEFSTRQLAGLGLDRSQLIAALQAQNEVIPSGVIQTDQEKLSLRVSGAFGSESDLLAINIPVNGRLLRLRDIAEIRRASVDPPQSMFRVNGRPAIGLAIAMRPGGDILALGRNVAKALEETKSELPIGIEPILVANQPQIVEHAIGDFMTSLWQAIAIIMAVSLISLGVRAGAVVAVSIPLTLAVVFPIMQLAGIDLQRISLGALIIALGLLVDDAMTTVDVMTTRLALGDEKEEAASYAYKTLAFPMLTGSFVSAAGFVPIGLAKSSAGEYTFSIFAVVSIALIVSWVVAVLFTPLIGVALLKKPDASTVEREGPVLRVFRTLLVAAMRAKWVTLGVTLACFVIALLATPLVPRQFFPASDRPELVIDLSLRQNASIYASQAVVEKFDKILKGDPDVASWSAYVGRGAIRFYLPLNVQLAHDFFSQYVVIAKDVAARDRLHQRLEKILAEDFPGLVTRIAPLELGPPVGWPVQYRVIGPDPEKVRQIALDLAKTIGADPSVRRINFDWIEPARAIHIKVDQDQARLVGLSSQALAAALKGVVTGQAVTQVRDDIYLVDVVARATDEQRMSLSTLQTLQIATPSGGVAPLGQIVTFDFQQENPLIWRRDRAPTLTVQADPAPGLTAETAVAALAPAVATVSASLPPQYRIDTGGTVEESAKSQGSVFARVPLMLFLMITLLMIQLQSFSRTLLVLSIVPMGLIGIIAALLIFGKPLGFVAILGILSLLGMIARNAVILVEQIETERREEPDQWKAVVDATLSRFRPITLTAVSTVLGLIPIAPTVFWGPMAFAVMGGLLVATVLTLIVTPALYVLWFGIREQA
ncbi:efflux RND transporter permease subunit [Methylocystis sp. L43]|uniref:efflux RND transporter permease subunit n=1 Tax=unclassified Methylocystis TaxID=2625913 RepID=UPI0018C2FD9A|nr:MULTISPECIES: efflux RND transporter permease subunit [unclassified Methylocystis]MBG0797521.1 efflux RND transporter permease subunit [Methylocystis sp. L43]MBG0805126.1 efflux RND transporter permease subunit [Methylocystis sp. H15]